MGEIVSSGANGEGFIGSGRQGPACTEPYSCGKALGSYFEYEKLLEGFEQYVGPSFIVNNLCDPMWE